MTTEGLGPELGTAGSSVTPAEALDVCDRIIGEPSRRRHLFAWLRAPDAPWDEWLPVDAYYPGRRLVIIWRSEPGPNDDLYRQLVPAHGLRLLELTPAKVAGEWAEAESRLRALLDAVGAAAPRTRVQPDVPARSRRQDGSPEAGAAVGSEWASAGSREPGRGARRTGAPAELSPLLRAVGGAGLVAIVIAELYAGVAVVGFDAGRPVLALGLALDACARALGTLAAMRERAPGWPWACAVGGSPFVASFAFGREQRATVEPAPLAGVLALLALVLVAAALIGIAA